MKIIFRYGESDARHHMLDEQDTQSVVYRYKAFDCPEFRRGQKEQRAWVIDKIVADEDIDIISNSDIIFGQLRLCVAQKMLKPEDFKVLYYEKNEKLELKVFPSGKVDPWPKNFMNENTNICLDLLVAEGRK